MRYNQYSYTPQDLNTALAELRELGFDLSLDQSDLVNFETFVRKTRLNYQDTDFPLSNLLADWETDLLSFFQSGRQLTDQVFYMVTLQLLDFIPHVDFEDLDQFLDKLNFPIIFGREPLLVQLYHLLNCRGKEGMTLIDSLVSQDLIPVDNAFHYFNGKSLATFDTSKLIREIVYVEAPLDTDGDGQRDLIKVRIIRPQTSVKLPALMTASPYHEGTNVPANDKKLYPMEGELTVKAAGTIQVQPTVFEELPAQTSTAPISQSQESFAHTSTYSLNDYMLARGFASLYVAGVGTAGSQGFMTSGDYAQIAAFKAVIDWLNGRATAYTSHKRDYQVQADWATGAVATTGKSYLGTMSTGLATTGVEGLRLIIAEAAISSWYDYYRENGLVCSPGGYPGEDLDVLTELTYSRNMVPGDYLKNNAHYQDLLKEQSAQLDRQTGDYNQFWQDRNYLPRADKIGIDLVYTHGLQDWNVKPGQVYQMLKALPETVRSHTFLHQGEHVYLNNWQSIDFRESMNALLCQKLLDLYNRFELPTVIWQDNSQEQTWQDLETFGRDNLYQIPLGQGEKTIQNQYPQETFDRYGKNFRAFKSDLFEGKAQALVLDIPLSQDLHLNGKPRLNLRLKSSQNRGILSAQLLDYGQKKGFSDLPAYLTLNSLDNGRNFAKEGLRELPFKEQAYRVVSKVVLNLQNRTDLLTIQEVQPDQWMDLTLELQPTIYKLATGDKLRVLLYTTDFEHTIRDNSDYQLTLDLDQSCLELPVE